MARKVRYFDTQPFLSFEDLLNYTYTPSPMEENGGKLEPLTLGWGQNIRSTQSRRSASWREMRLV